MSEGREISPGHRIVAASRIQEGPYKCPHCESIDLTLTGTFRRAFEQKYVEGKPAEGVQLAPQATQEINNLICAKCGIHTYIEADEVFEREQMIFDLQTQVATLQGRVSTSSTKEWKN